MEGKAVRRVGFTLYLITDRTQTARRALTDVVELALTAGVGAIQLREKDLPDGEFLALAIEMRRITARTGAKLFINDRVDAAIEVGADGVHLSRRGCSPREARKKLGEQALIGVSTHSAEEALAAESAGADFVTLGPIYETATKRRYGSPIGVKTLSEASRALDIPVFAIGGINRSKVSEVLEAGAYGAAVISAVISAGDVKLSASQLMAEFQLELDRPTPAHATLEGRKGF